MRASIYNAFPPEGVTALVDFMRTFDSRVSVQEFVRVTPTSVRRGRRRCKTAGRLRGRMLSCLGAEWRRSAAAPWPQW
ncbi:MAG: hypothetical protein R3B90_17985 [Planctomycetaceae bacterium]